MDDDDLMSPQLVLGALVVGFVAGMSTFLAMTELLMPSTRPYLKGFDAGVQQGLREGMIRCKEQPERCDLIYRLHLMESQDD